MDRCTKDYMHPAEHEVLEHPYKAEVFVEGEWAGNALTFATPADAYDYGAALLMRWFVPTDHRVVNKVTGEVVGELDIIASRSDRLPAEQTDGSVTGRAAND